MNLEAFQITRQVIRSPGVQYPRIVDGVGGGRVGGASVVVLVIALAAIIGIMPPVFANLTPGAPAIVATATIAVVAIVAPATLPTIVGLGGVAVAATVGATVAALAALPELAVNVA